MGQGLLVGEVALSVTLLVAAGVLLHNLIRLQRLDPGYETDGLASVDLVVPETSPDPRARAASYDQILETVRSLPLLQRATLSDPSPIHDLVFAGTVRIPDTGDVHERVLASFTRTAPGYFGAMGIPILEGRDFNAEDIASVESPVIVSRGFAERLFPGASATGKVFVQNPEQRSVTYRVVGVVATAIQSDPMDLREGRGQVYAPLWTVAGRSPEGGGPPRNAVALVFRLPPGSAAPLAALAERLRSLNVEVDVRRGITPVRESMAPWLDGPRFRAILFGTLAAVGLALAVVGLYGVVSHWVQSRAREMGIRLAVGAGARDVRRLVLLQGMIPAAIGIAVGLGGATLTVYAISGLLFYVEPLDPPVFVLVPAVVLAITALAIWVPAVRATRVDPVAVLRED